MARTKYPKSKHPHHLYEQQAERVAVVGSRRYPRLDEVAAYVASLKRPMTLPEHQPVIVTGTDPERTAAQGKAKADGVDEVAFRAAKAAGLQRKAHHPPAWDRQTLLHRNGLIVADCHRLVAFWDYTDPKSTGTAYTIREALAAGRPVVVYGPGGLADVVEVEVVDNRVVLKESGREEEAQRARDASHDPGDTLAGDEGIDLAAALESMFGAKLVAVSR